MTECQGKNCTIIKKLLDTKSLNCQSCNKLLQLPVFFADGIGNVCEKCRWENVDWKYTPNEIFDVLLEELIIPCTNATIGCNEEIPYERMEEHLKLCKYRPVKCPHQGCTWMEWQDNLSSHFLESHEENVIESETFAFNLNLNEAYVAFAKLLIKGNLKFLFLFQRDKEADELSLSLFKFREDGPSSTIITCSSDEEMNFYCFKTEINLLDLIDQNCKVNKINLTLLKSMFQEGDELTLNVKIPPDDHMLEILECPVCTETMRSPIYLCEKGHSICNVCFEKIKTCPTCQAIISGGTRNYSLESVTSKMFYSCSYKSSGCDAVLLGDQIMEHEANCLHHFYKCPLNNCDFQYNAKNILQHLSDEHEVNEFEYDLPTHGYANFSWNVDHYLYISGCFFRVKYLKPNTVPPSCPRPFHSMKYAFLEFEHLNSEKQFPNLYSKSTLTNKKTQAEVTQIHFLKNAEKSGRYYYIFLPIEAMSDFVDVSRTGSYNLKCEILMK